MDGVHIVQARVRGPGSGPDVQARLARRADAALRALDPGEAILCLRRAGGRIAADALEQPLHRPSSDWQAIIAQARRRLDAARRPWLEVIGPAADAVRFADTAEWLACAARDLLAGELSHWWWCSLPGAGAEGVFAAWRTHPQAVPAALALLAGEGRALAFAQACTPHAEPMRQALQQRFAIPAPSPAFSSASTQAVAAALADCAQPAGAALHPTARSWLWLALGLARVPAAVRNAPLPPANWLLAAEPAAMAADTTPISESRPLPAVGAATVAEPASAPPPGEVAPLATQQAHGAPSGDTAAPLARVAPDAPAVASEASASRLAPQAADGAPPSPSATQPGARPPAPPGLQWQGQAPLTAELPEQPECELPRPERLPGASVRQVVPDATAQATPSPTAANTVFVAPAPAALDTAFGGVFHLLNLALALGLYPDFTRPAERGISLHPWDLLSLLARRMLGAAFESDPLADWLARAAGRPADLPPACWADPPAADWCLPEDWLMPWADQSRAWRQVVGPDRHALWHPAGFCVADLPRRELLRGNDWPGWVAPRRIAQRGRPAPRAIADWADWVARLTPFLAARLAAATGFATEEVAERLLRRPARIVRSGDAIEVRMSLAALPIELRLAGLDRDLGWLPAAGCALRYRFAAEVGR